jgi:hypothetical protein
MCVVSTLELREAPGDTACMLRCACKSAGSRKATLAVPPFRLLIVTNAAARDIGVLPPLVAFLIEAASARFVVSPRLTTPLEWLDSDVDRADGQARERLGTVLEHFSSGPAPISGAVGDETILLAVEDAIRGFAPDHLLVGLRSYARTGRQERRLIDGMRRRFQLPLTVFEVDESRRVDET